MELQTNDNTNKIEQLNENSQAKKSLDSSEDEVFKCKKCCEYFNKTVNCPLQLNCGHIICKQCLILSNPSNHLNGILMCPLDNEMFTETLISSLHPSLVILEHLPEINNNSEFICKYHKFKKIKYICEFENEALCDICKENHCKENGHNIFEFTPEINYLLKDINLVLERINEKKTKLNENGNKLQDCKCKLLDQTKNEVNKLNEKIDYIIKLFTDLRILYNEKIKNLFKYQSEEIEELNSLIQEQYKQLGDIEINIEKFNSLINEKYLIYDVFIENKNKIISQWEHFFKNDTSVSLSFNFDHIIENITLPKINYLYVPGFEKNIIKFFTENYINKTNNTFNYSNNNANTPSIFNNSNKINSTNNKENVENKNLNLNINTNYMSTSNNRNHNTVENSNYSNKNIFNNLNNNLYLNNNNTILNNDTLNCNNSYNNSNNANSEGNNNENNFNSNIIIKNNNINNIKNNKINSIIKDENKAKSKNSNDSLTKKVKNNNNSSMEKNLKNTKILANSTNNINNSNNRSDLRIRTMNNNNSNSIFENEYSQLRYVQKEILSNEKESIKERIITEVNQSKRDNNNNIQSQRYNGNKICLRKGSDPSKKKNKKFYREFKKEEKPVLINADLSLINTPCINTKNKNHLETSKNKYKNKNPSSNVSQSNNSKERSNSKHSGGYVNNKYNPLLTS